MKQITLADLIKLDENTYEIPVSYREDMRVPAQVFVNEEMIHNVLNDKSMWQLVNMSTLPGIQKAAYAMPDVHEGYGFPIGGVAAYAIDEGGVISPGGIGYDINCGVRLLVANAPYQDIKDYLEPLADKIFHKVPSGVGKGGSLKLSLKELDVILKTGAKGMLEQGFGLPEDIEFCEEHGCMEGADPRSVSERAKKRGSDQLGTLGSGNHFLEIQRVDKIYDERIAQVYGLKVDDVTVMIHCGSRGLGHQVCSEYVRTMLGKLDEFGIELPDRELVCAPFTSHIAQEYFSAMKCAANFAWANRHMIGHWVREIWQKVLGSSAQLSLVYDLSHNMGKVEEHDINGSRKKVVIHRKGATRAFGPGRSEMPPKYQPVGQPVLIPGTMGTASYVLAGTQESMIRAFGSSCHGAGRLLSRSQAKKTIRGSELRATLEQEGIIIKSDSDPGLAEEAPAAYKDVDNVVQVVEGAGLARRVARVRPLAVIKGG